MGRIVPEVEQENIRGIFVGNYRIIYQLEEKQISVLTVRQGKQLLSNDDLE